MALLQQLKQLLSVKPRDDQREAPRKRKDSPFVGHSSTKEIENAPPERAAELAGHAVERVDT